MSNRYSLNIGRESLQSIFEVTRGELTGIPTGATILCDHLAPVIRTNGNDRQLEMMRWGMPGPLKGSRLVLNIRTMDSRHWSGFLGQTSRCIVPFTSFCEFEETKSPRKPHWFSADQTRPLLAFAGIWTTWYGVRGQSNKSTDGKHRIFALMTCEPNSVVRKINPKSMPVVLDTLEECKLWLDAPWSEARELQSPLADESLMIVASGSSTDHNEVDQTPLNSQAIATGPESSATEGTQRFLERISTLQSMELYSAIVGSPPLEPKSGGIF